MSSLEKSSGCFILAAVYSDNAEQKRVTTLTGGVGDDQPMIFPMMTFVEYLSS